MEEKDQEQEPKKTQEPITIPDIEGGVLDWVWVCGNFRSQVDWHTDPCPYCKWRINWHG